MPRQRGVPSTSLARLVSLDAFVAADGQSLFDVLRPERREQLESSAQHGLVPAPSPETFGVTERRDWVADRLTPQPLRTFTEKLSAPSEPPVPRLYARCTQGPLVASFAGTRPTDVAALLVT